MHGLFHEGPKPYYNPHRTYERRCRVGRGGGGCGFDRHRRPRPAKDQGELGEVRATLRRRRGCLRAANHLEKGAVVLLSLL